MFASAVRAASRSMPRGGGQLVLFRRTKLTDASRATIAAGPGLDDFILGTPAAQADSPQTKPKGKLPKKPRERLPDWLKTKIPTSKNYNKIKDNLRDLNLHTVCEEARCPNIGECWGGEEGTATATIMVRHYVEGGQHLVSLCLHVADVCVSRS
eukprot:m.17849 g.17849  ORF g.17849 m.17849 type:complete len:154 (+) comp5563_c0_seq1:388-849(+)